MAKWTIGACRFADVALPLVLVLSYCGGPLFVFDEVESAAGTGGGMAIAFGPVAAAVACGFSLWRGHPLSLGRWGVACGLIAILLILLMNAFTISQLLTLPPLPQIDGAVLMFGILMGMIAAAAYVWLAYLRFRS